MCMNFIFQHFQKKNWPQSDLSTFTDPPIDYLLELTVKTILWLFSSYDMVVPHSSRPCSMVKTPGDGLVSPQLPLESAPTNASSGDLIIFIELDLCINLILSRLTRDSNPCLHSYVFPLKDKHR